MSSQKSRQLSTPVLVAIAILLGSVAGAWWVYGKQAASGNGYPVELERETAAADVRECAAQEDIGQALAPFAKGEVAAMTIQEPARGLPVMEFRDGAGDETNLAAFAGRPLLVNFWATWCAPCRAEMPALAELQREMGGEDFQVLAINIDTGELDKPRAFLEEIGVDNLGLHHDQTMGVFNALKKEGLAFGLPATLLVGADGCLLGVMNGPAEWASADAKALIGKLIEVSSSAETADAEG